MNLPRLRALHALATFVLCLGCQPPDTEAEDTAPPVILTNPYSPDCGEGDGCWLIDGEVMGQTANGGYLAYAGENDGVAVDKRRLRLTSQSLCGDGSGFSTDNPPWYRCNTVHPNGGSELNVLSALDDLGPITELDAPITLSVEMRLCHDVDYDDADMETYDAETHTIDATFYHRPYDDQEIEVAVLGTWEDQWGEPHDLWVTGRLLMCDELGETGYRDPR